MDAASDNVDPPSYSRLRQIKINTNREAHHQNSLKAEYGYVAQQTPDVKDVLKSTLKSSCNPESICTLKNVWKFTTNRIPILKWARTYDIRTNLGNDVLAGITVGVMHIPQGMAYGILAKVSPIIGLYVSFFPALIFFLLGTSHHVSIGTFAVVSIMLGKTVDDVLERRKDILFDLANSTRAFIALDENNTLPVNLEDDEFLFNQAATEILMVVCFIVGVIQFALGILQLGVFSVYLSDILVSGFTTGAAVHVFTSQVKHIFGVAVPSRSGVFKVFYTYLDILSVIHQSNYIAVIISVVTIALLEIFNQLINPRFRARFKFLIPVELLAIILGTTACHFGNFDSDFNLKVVGTIPTGIPPPRSIRWNLIPEVIVDSIPIAVVGFTILLSMSKLFAKKGGYKVNANQDLLAIGTANVIASFFSCFPCCVSLSRTLLQYSSGGKTQIASLVSCIFMMIILVSIGPLFQELPYCILSAVIVVAIRGMFRQVSDFKNAWRVCKTDSAIWLITFLGVVVFDVDIGLGIGLAALIFSTVLRSQRPESCLLGQLPRTEIYVDVSKFTSAAEHAGLKVFRFYAAPYFANRDFFRKELFRLVGLNPVELVAKQLKLNAKKQRDCIKNEAFNEQTLMKASGSKKSLRYHSMTDMDVEKDEKKSNCSVNVTEINAIAIDCSNWNSIDSAGINIILQVIDEYRAVDVAIYLSGCLDPVMSALENHPLYAEVLEPRMFPTVSDVMAHLSQGDTVNEVLRQASVESLREDLAVAQ